MTKIFAKIVACCRYEKQLEMILFNSEPQYADEVINCLFDILRGKFSFIDAISITFVNKDRKAGCGMNRLSLQIEPKTLEIEPAASVTFVQSAPV